jgi:sec-independent protein translocase protein TatA
MMPYTLAIFGTVDWKELVVLGIVGLLIFGKRLPEVAKNLGRGVVEFKKGLSGIEDKVSDSNPAAPAQVTENSADSATQPQLDNAATVTADSVPQAADESPSEPTTTRDA